MKPYKADIMDKLNDGLIFEKFEKHYEFPSKFYLGWFGYYFCFGWYKIVLWREQRHAFERGWRSAMYFKNKIDCIRAGTK